MWHGAGQEQGQRRTGTGHGRAKGSSFLSASIELLNFNQSLSLVSIVQATRIPEYL